MGGSVIRAVVKGVGYELVSCWAVGLLRNKDNPFAATSLDGWLIVKENDSMDEDYTPMDDVFEYGADSDYETDLEIYSDVDETLSDISPMNDSDESLLTPNKSKHTKKSRPTRACQVDALTLTANEDYTLSWGLEIKSPSSKKVITSKVIPAKNLHGTFSTCEFGDVAFHQLVFDNAYKMQLVHHAAVCNLDSVLFVVASETGVRYATLVHVPFEFIKDPTLDRIRKDTRLEHFPQSVPKKSSSSSNKSSKGNKAIPKKKKTDRKESTRCALCVGLL